MAARQGDAYSQRLLGVMHHFGKGVPQNYVLAFMWYRLAAAHGYANASKTIGSLNKIMTPEQKKEAEDLEKNWKAKHKFSQSAAE
jgi:TPR repeat protein